MRRVLRFGDGWMPVGTDPDALAPTLERIRAVAGRPLGVQGRIDDIENAGALRTGWERLGATHVALNTMNQGRSGVDAHLAALDGVA